jgi:UDP-N-acetylmuramoylalanine--D-glutamate ligase
MELEGKSAVVVGLARSGIAAARFLAGRGARVVATDRKPADGLPEEALSLARQGVVIEVGGHTAAAFAGASMVVVSPGVPWDMPELAAARLAGVPVMAELELAYRNLVGSVAAVTGTKGKSTTTAALGAMLRAAGLDVRVGGNIGEPLIGQVEGAKADTIFAVEASSFQLEGIDTFRPKVAVFLNLSADHLDRHASFEDYARAKGRIFRNQTSDDWAVVNADDEGVLSLARGSRARQVLFSPGDSAAPLPVGDRGPHPPPLSQRERGDVAHFDNGRAVLRRNGSTETLFDRARVQLPGPHLAGDLLAAAVAARLMGASTEAIARAAHGFRGVEHVLELVGEVNGVRFFNDSKATNIDAARKSLLAFEGPVLAIIGGRYKGGDFRDLADVARGRCKAVLAIGEAQERIVRALESVVPVLRCETMDAAVDQAFGSAAPGDTVLLAPACSSFDMFSDYADRGQAFKAAVRRLVSRQGE